MTIANRLRGRAAGATRTAGGIAIAGTIAATGLALPVGAAAAAPTIGTHVTAYSAPAPRLARQLDLTSMPTGQLVVRAGELRLREYGLTPGSSHQVAISFLGLLVPLGTLTASSGGSARWSYSWPAASAALSRAEAHAGGHAPPGSPAIRVVTLNAGRGTPVIGQTPLVTGPGRYPVRGVEPGYGVIKAGSAILVYNLVARTISVTVNATGLTPGAHAAHIHVGSCQRQGAVVYAFTDFIANSHGVIAHETRTVRGVTAVKFSGWYFNLHQGNSDNIVNKAGQPTIYFRPLECANL